LAVAALLIIADRCYFLAVGNPDALISIITVLRRSSVFISFLAGILIFRERKSKLKLVALLGIVVGLCLISLGKG
jgi:transporter family protein